MRRSEKRCSSKTNSRRRSLQIQPLEDRKLMAVDLTATLDLNTRLFRIEGTPNNDTILVREQAGQVSVQGIAVNMVNGTSTTRVGSFDRSLIGRVEVVALGGNDTVDLQSVNLAALASAPIVKIWAGDGDDTLTGTKVADQIMGENGNDTIAGLDGNDALYGGFELGEWEAGSADRLYGGAGNDRLVGGSGDDQMFGEADNDTLEGGYGNDSLYGGAGDDSLNGNADLDTLDGGADNDTLYTGWFRDTLAGGDGVDTLVAPYSYASLSNSDFRYLDQYFGLMICPLSSIEKGYLTASEVGWGYTRLDAGGFSGSLAVVGTPVNDGITGGSGADTFYGGGGPDTLVGGGGDDVIYGGPGNDTLEGGYGNDTLYGGEDDDFLDGNADLDTLDGGSGNDTLSTGWFRDTLIGGIGYDTLKAPVTLATLTNSSFSYWDYYYGWMNCTISGFEEASLTLNDNWGVGYTRVIASGFSGRSVISGTPGTDYLTGGPGDDLLAGMGGDDVILGNGGNDTIYGGEGGDYIDGGNGMDQLFGDGGNDTIFGGIGDDLISGGYGDDSLSGGDGNDRIYGGDGYDTLQGGEGNDLLAGYRGNDVLWGDNGIDTLIGGEGADVLHGGTGDDILVAIDGAAADHLYGEEGADSLWSDALPGFWGPVYDSAALDSLDRLLGVTNFANSADLSLDADSQTLQGDRIADPLDGTNYKNFSDHLLFGDLGPTPDDVQQGNVWDCWLMSTLSATARQSQTDIRQMVVDFGDGTYGVHLGDKFYRVDADLPRANASTNDLLYAKFGKQDSLWVAIVEKAYASYRFGPESGANAYRQNTYEGLAWGGAGEAMRALNLKDWSASYYPSSSSDVSLANELYNHWKAGRITCVTFGHFLPAGARLSGDHFYSVAGVNVDALGQVSSITLRNPYGGDNAYITVGVTELGMYNVGIDSARA